MTGPRREVGCYSCERETAENRPPREEVWASDVWRVAHAFDTALPGWLVVIPRRHVTAFVDLSAAEAAELGPLLVALGSALSEVVGCVKTYMVQFAEAEGFAHVHIHVVPRAADLALDLRGPGIFALLGRPEEERVPTEEQDGLALRLRAALDALNAAKSTP